MQLSKKLQRLRRQNLFVSRAERPGDNDPRPCLDRGHALPLFAVTGVLLPPPSGDAFMPERRSHSADGVW